MSGLPVERSPEARRAYLDGFEAGLRLFEERLKRHVSGEASAIRAAAAETRSIGDLVRATMEEEE